MTDDHASDDDQASYEGGVASAHLAGVAALARGQGSISIEEVLEALGPTSLAFAIVFLALPAMIPIPGPFGMVFGTMLALVALQIMVGSRTIWLPGFLRRRRLSASTIEVMVRHTAPLVSRVEGWMRPGRLKALTGRTALMLIGLPVFLLAVAVALPIPFGNILPVLSLTVIGAGLLERDGLATLIGIVLATLSLGASAGLIFGGAAAIAAVFT